MKIKINTLLGAVLSLLVTFRLKQNATPFARLLILGLAVLVAAPSHAAKPGGGGGGGTPEGTIYYIGPYAGQEGTAIMTTMNPDGSNQTTLGGQLFGNPSTVPHNNHLWFIYTFVIPDQYYPDTITKRSEAFALRDDYSFANNNNATTRVQLTDDKTLQIKVGSEDWLPGDGLISFTARRWVGSTVVEAGIYTASLVFGADGNIIGLAEQPVAPTIPFPLVETPADGPWPELADYSWDSTGTQVVYAGYGDIDLWKANLLNEHTRIYVGSAFAPQWSPVNGKIAFSHGGIATINLDGTGFKQIIRNTGTWSFYWAYWSRDGNYIAYTGQQLPGNLDVFRATATGGSQVNLTGTPSPLRELPIGWR